MKPLIFPITVCKNEDVWIRPVIEAWLPFAETMFVQDTGSIDRTMGELADIVSTYPGKVMIGQYEMGVGESMVERQRLIERIPKEHEYWIVLLDADEVWPESQLRAFLARLENPDVDYVACRPVAIGCDLKSSYGSHYFEPENPADLERYTTTRFCDKWTTRAFRASRLDAVVNPSWGGETFVVKLDTERHEITPDFKEQKVPPGTINTMFTGRTDWTDIYFCHMTNHTRSSKWAEIQQVPGSNAMDRARWRTRGSVGNHRLPEGFEIPDSVRTIVTSQGWPF